MAGEMSQEEVTRESYPSFFAVADALGCGVRAFDQYQGPYVDTNGLGSLFLCSEEKVLTGDNGFQVPYSTGLVYWYNDYNEMVSEKFPHFLDDSDYVEAALSTCNPQKLSERLASLA